MPTRHAVAGMILVALGTFAVIAQQRESAPSAAPAKTVAAATGFLQTLDERQRQKVILPLNVTTRTVWSNLPTGTTLQSGATERNGLKLGDMTQAQQAAALAVVAAALSDAGYEKVMSIVDADQRLQETSGNSAASRVKFGRAEYYVAILGTPSERGRWMLQFGGHHLAINVTMAGGSQVLTPSHTGAQPASYSLNGATVRPLGRESDKAFALMNALDAVQQKQALLDYQIRNLVLGPGEDGKQIAPEGIRGTDLSEAQRALLLDLIGEWVTILDGESASAKLKEVEGRLPDTYFAWAGATTNGSAAYFRIQGPTVFIEYAPQGANGPVNHIHTIYRDPTDDYGAKLTAR